MSVSPTSTQKQTNRGFCAICQSDLGPRDKAVHCPACNAVYHADCWTDNGGCAVYGCSAVPPTEKLQDVEVPVSYWGKEDKTCPACGQSIMAVAIRCRYCGAQFETARPQDRGEFVAVAIRKQRTPTLGKQAIWVLITGLIPFTAPFALVIGGLWYQRNRKDLAAMPTAYHAMALIGLGIAAVQIVLIAFILLLQAILG
jgi:hypothetical protein